MKEIYLKPNQIEKIFAQYGPSVGGSWSGSLFEYYILTTIKNLQLENKYLIFKIKDNHDNDQLIHIAPLTIKKIVIILKQLNLKALMTELAVIIFPISKTLRYLIHFMRNNK